MLPILGIVLLIALSKCDLSEPTVLTRFESNEIFNEIPQSYTEQNQAAYPTIHPDISEDSKLNTVQLQFTSFDF